MGTRGTILLVEDDPNDQLMIESGLRDAGSHCHIHTSSDGAEAIAYLKGEGPYADRSLHPYPTFLITDLKMSRVDGLGLLEFLRSRPQFAIIPTVVFSASADPDDVLKAYLLGASSYHVKPATAAAFAAQLKILYDYWSTCEVPEVDHTGMRRPTNSRGRLGERYSSDPFP